MSPVLLMPLAPVDVEPGYWMTVGTNVSVVADHVVVAPTSSSATAIAAVYFGNGSVIITGERIVPPCERWTRFLGFLRRKAQSYTGRGRLRLNFCRQNQRRSLNLLGRFLTGSVGPRVFFSIGPHFCP